ncbi:hypothetical protein GC174_03455 [bacterium]|nr:hypothetical protein [bacterium]
MTLKYAVHLLASTTLALNLLLGPGTLSGLALEELQEPPTLEGNRNSEDKTRADYVAIDLATVNDTSGSTAAPSELDSPSENEVDNDGSDKLLAQGDPQIDLKPPISVDGDSSDKKMLKLSATASNEYEEINKLSNRILKKEVELLKLNTEFRINSTKQSKWKRWSAFGFNMAASAVSFSGITTVAWENWRTHHNFRKGNRETFITGPLLLLIGHSIVLGGIVVESGLDKLKEYKDWKKGISPGGMTKKVLVLQNEIDTLINERDKALKAYRHPSDLQKNFMNAEGKVLRDVRDLALVEFASFYVRARKRAVSRDAAYVNGSAIAATGGYQGSLNGMLSVINKRRMQAVPAGLGFLESGALIVLAPWINRGAAAVTGKVASKNIRKKLGDLGNTTIKQLETDLRDLKTVTAQLPDSLKPKHMTHRIDLYDDGQGVFEQQKLFDAAEKSKSKKEFWERVLYNSAIGGTKMAWGINLTYAGAAFPTGGGHKVEQFRRIVANGSTTFVVGTSIWMFDTIQARTRGEIDLYTMGVNQATPIHKLNRRLDMLNKLDEKLKI